MADAKSDTVRTGKIGQGDHVRVDRLSYNERLLEAGHTLRGGVVRPTLSGESLAVLRYESNGQSALGEFVTTRVVALTDAGAGVAEVQTESGSIYRVTRLHEPWPDKVEIKVAGDPEEDAR